MKNLKPKIGALFLGVGLAVGGYFIGHHTPKYVTVDKSFIEEFETVKPGFLDNKIQVIKGKQGSIERLILDKEKDIEMLFLGTTYSFKPNYIELQHIWILQCNRYLAWYYAPGTLSEENIKSWEQKKTFEFYEMTIKEKILWEKLYKELSEN